ncbi:MAG TPA: hypothetical protein PLM41_12930, partial [Saprospiraceae bacterium]|nr:hypothetical protein [Saprospiraceae bacterium]
RECHAAQPRASAARVKGRTACATAGYENMLTKIERISVPTKAFAKSYFPTILTRVALARGCAA